MYIKNIFFLIKYKREIIGMYLYIICSRVLNDDLKYFYMDNNFYIYMIVYSGVI